MSAFVLGAPYVDPGDGIHRAQNTSYGVHINLDDGIPTPSAFALHQADFCLEINGRKVELSWPQLCRKLGLRHQ